MKFVMHLSNNGRLTAQKKKKYQYKYSTRRETFSSIIQAQSIRINTRSRAENNREKHDQKKRNIFPKGRTTSEKFETIVITTIGNNRNVRLREQEHNEAHIIPETQLSQNDEGEDVQVSTEKNNFLFHAQCAVHGRDTQK